MAPFQNIYLFSFNMVLLARMTRVLLCTLPVLCSLFVTGESAQLGPPQEDKTASELFASVGSVYIEIFRIDAGMNATLDVRIEDTPGADEYWLLDFQPYQYNYNNPPINKVTASLDASRTGQCSSAEQDQTWQDGYFHDDFFQNHSAIGSKLLFTDFTRGSVIINGRRGDSISFAGNMNTFLTCEKTDGSNIWDSNIYAEEIEYNTVLYATNLRPQFDWQPDTSLQIPAVGYVQNNIHLIWRLTRTAIVNFIISSEQITFINLFAIFDYAIVEPVLLQDGITPDIEKTRLFMGFTTYVPVEDSIMLTYISDSVTYEPLVPENALLQLVVQPTDVLTSTPLCNTIRDVDYCSQSWNYEMILQLDITQLTTEMPLEATGVFGFDFNLYECPDLTLYTGCSFSAAIDEPFNVLIDLTLQSTVTALDEAGDEITVEIAGVTNDAGEDIRNGVVNNRENVTVEVLFYPAFLRDEYKLDLHLFMVCKGAEYEHDTTGCLAAPEEDRFTSFVSDDLSYEYDASEDPNYVLVPSTPAPPEVDQWCGDGWQKVDDACYWLEHTARATYMQATAECSARDSMLATITNQGEQNYLAGLLIDFKDGGYYIGLNDIETENVFVWADGTPFNPSVFEAWAGGEPNNLGEEDCVGLRPSRGGDWNDYKCSQHLLAYICEKPADRWSDYAFWTSCSVTCGSGSRRRTRVCESGNSADCPGSSLQTQRCLMRGCELYPTDQGQVLRYESSDYDMPYSAIDAFCQSKGGRPSSIHSKGLRNHLFRDYDSLVYPKLIPLVGKEATQSSPYLEPGYASLAIDGNSQTTFADNTSCSHTTTFSDMLEYMSMSDSFYSRFDFPGWWMVYLEEEYCVSKVSIVNRGDCCEDRLVDAFVSIGNDPERDTNLQCGSPISASQAGLGVTVDVVCSQPICGQYISIQAGSRGEKILTLCEVTAYGHHSKYNPDDVCLEDASVGWPAIERPLSHNTINTAQTYILRSQSVPCDGQITSWSFWVVNDTIAKGKNDTIADDKNETIADDANIRGPVGLIIWRLSEGDSSEDGSSEGGSRKGEFSEGDSSEGNAITYEIIGFDLLPTVYVGFNEVNFTEETFINVKMGDLLGLAWYNATLASDMVKGDSADNLWITNDGDIEDLAIGQTVTMDVDNADARTFSIYATVEPYPEVIPHYWVDGYDVSGCLQSGEEGMCPVLSNCGSDAVVEMPCHQSYRAICEYDHVAVFHAVGGNGGNVLDMWESPESHQSYSRVDAGQHYKSPLVDDWDQRIIGVDEVKVVLQKYGQDVLTLIFDGTDTNKHDWFTLDRLISSPYTEINNYNVFDIRAFHDAGNPYRHFYINERFASCTNDVGWLVVLERQDEDYNGCAYELAVPPNKPAFLYSDGPGATNWGDASVADDFLIYIKYKEKVISEPSRFDLAFRGIAGSGQNILNLWDSASYSDNGGRIAYGQHYKSDLVEKWHGFLISVDEVRVQLRRDGDLVLQMSFDGQDTDKYDWFTRSRIIDSPFTGLDDRPQNYFSVAGHPGINRGFFINEYYNTCPDDQGWFVVVDHGDYHPCQWDNNYGTDYPKFLFSTTGASTNWENGNVGTADELLIYIKYTNDPVTPPPPTYPPPIEYTSENVPPVIEARALDVAEYDNERNIHQTKFENRPLADERVTITMTTVYMLVPKNETRRKRDVRHRRSLVTSIQLPQMASTTFGSNGCPPHSRFNPLEFSCDCLEGYQYNSKLFTCDGNSTGAVEFVELTGDWTMNNNTVEDNDVVLSDSGKSQIGLNCYLIYVIVFFMCLVNS